MVGLAILGQTQTCCVAILCCFKGAIWVSIWRIYWLPTSSCDTIVFIVVDFKYFVVPGMYTEYHILFHCKILIIEYNSKVNYWYKPLAYDPSFSIPFQGLLHYTRCWPITRCYQLGYLWCVADLSRSAHAHNGYKIAWWQWKFPFGKQPYHGTHCGMMHSL